MAETNAFLLRQGATQPTLWSCCDEPPSNKGVKRKPKSLLKLAVTDFKERRLVMSSSWAELDFGQRCPVR